MEAGRGEVTNRMGPFVTNRQKALVACAHTGSETYLSFPKCNQEGTKSWFDKFTAGACPEPVEACLRGRCRLHIRATHAAGRSAPLLVAFGVVLIVAAMPTASAQQRGGRGGLAPQEPRTGKSSAPIDLTGYWVAVITEDWRWRMLTPPKGDAQSVPINGEGKRVTDSWDLEKDNGAALQCKAFGVGGIMRQPGRLHITWQDDSTLKIETDAGTQTRLLNFDRKFYTIASAPSFSACLA